MAKKNYIRYSAVIKDRALGVVLLSPAGSEAAVGKSVASLLALKYLNLNELFTEKAQKCDKNLAFDRFPFDVALHEIARKTMLCTTGYVFEVCIDGSPLALRQMEMTLPPGQIWVRTSDDGSPRSGGGLRVKEGFLVLEESVDEIPSSARDLEHTLESFAQTRDFVWSPTSTDARLIVRDILSFICK